MAARRIVWLFCCALLALVIGHGFCAPLVPGAAETALGPALPARIHPVPPLPPPTGRVIRVSTVDGLFEAVAQVQPGETILLAQGHYWMPRYIELRTDGVTLRGAPGDPRRVILDGARSQHGELLGLRACRGVTVADLTIQNVRFNGLKINSDSDVQQVTVHNCIFHNIWQRAIKGVRVPPERLDQWCPADFRVQYCIFYNDRPKQPGDDPTDTPQSFGGNYVGGIDVMFARRWTISDNVFYGIRGRSGEARGAVFLWHESHDCLVERNVIVDCDSGICLGNSHRPAEIALHCRRTVVRNNFVVRAHENGILADYTADCAIVHNTIHDPESRLRRLIRLVHANDGLLVANNLLSGPPMRVETQTPVSFAGNVVQELSGAFVDPQRGDLHLRGPIAGIHQAVRRLAQAPEDIDRQERGPMCAAGADER